MPPGQLGRTARHSRLASPPRERITPIGKVRIVLDFSARLGCGPCGRLLAPSVATSKAFSLQLGAFLHHSSLLDISAQSCLFVEGTKLPLFDIFWLLPASEAAFPSLIFLFNGGREHFAPQSANRTAQIPPQSFPPTTMPTERPPKLRAACNECNAAKVSTQSPHVISYTPSRPNSPLLGQVLRRKGRLCPVQNPEYRMRLQRVASRQGDRPAGQAEKDDNARASA